MQLDTNIIKKHAEKHGLLLVVLFGSRSTGKTHPHSDTDIGFLPERQMSPHSVAEIQLAFTEALKIKDLELVNFRNVSPLFLKAVFKSAQLLYEREPSAFARFKIYAIKLYLEAKPLYRLREKSLQQYLQTV